MNFHSIVNFLISNKEFILVISILIPIYITAYNFFRMRYFSPRVELDLNHRLLKIGDTNWILFLEVVMKNIGKGRLHSERCVLELVGIVYNNEDKRFEYHPIEYKDDILDFHKDKSQKFDNINKLSTPFKSSWYIEAGEVDYRADQYYIDRSYATYLVILKYFYGRYPSKKVTIRKFYFELETSSKKTIDGLGDK